MIGSLGVFLGVTVAFMGGCAWLAGQALASAWRPWPHCLGYALLLTAGDRFLCYALFEGSLLSPAGFVVDGVVLTAIILASWRRTHAHRMAVQYPWLYERSGLFGWRAR